MIVTTARVHVAFNDLTTDFAEDVMDALGRFGRCDWGTICEEDKAVNDAALKHRERILAAYPTCKGSIWIITDAYHEGKPLAESNQTTILFPDEY